MVESVKTHLKQTKVDKDFCWPPTAPPFHHAHHVEPTTMETTAAPSPTKDKRVQTTSQQHQQLRDLAMSFPSSLTTMIFVRVLCWSFVAIILDVSTPPKKKTWGFEHPPTFPMLHRVPKHISWVSPADPTKNGWIYGHHKVGPHNVASWATFYLETLVTWLDNLMTRAPMWGQNKGAKRKQKKNNLGYPRDPITFWEW